MPTTTKVKKTAERDIDEKKIEPAKNKESCS